MDDYCPKPDTLKGYVGLSGVGVFYPINRAEDTPRDRLCLTDLMRIGLGVGPCEYILDLDARQPYYKGIFTCSYGGMLGRIFPDDMKGGREFAERVKEERYFVRRYNRNVQTFVRNVEKRINDYVDFGLGLTAYLDEQEKKQPQQGAFVAKVKAEWAKPVWQYGAQLGNTTKCENEKIAVGWLAEFNKALRLDTVEQATKGMVVGAIPHDLGDPGDRRLRNLRRKTAVIRAMATMEMAMNPAAGEMAKEIRKRTEAVLRNPHNYERVTVW